MSKKPKKAPAKKKAKAKVPAKRGRGRPRVEFSADQIFQVFKLAKLHCTYDEIASMIGVSVDTVRDRIREEGSDFSEAYKKGIENGKITLRRMQFRSALKGNVTMQIFLGKNLLGQKDKMDVDHDMSNYESAIMDLRDKEEEIIRKARGDGRMNGNRGVDESDRRTH